MFNFIKFNYCLFLSKIRLNSHIYLSKPDRIIGNGILSYDFDIPYYRSSLIMYMNDHIKYDQLEAIKFLYKVMRDFRTDGMLCKHVP